jgi:uncharacterized protein (TIGR04255 family)
MPTHRHYNKAPITEALIDLRVDYGPGISLDKLRSFGDRIRNKYPNSSPRDILQGQFDLTNQAEPRARSSRITTGYIFHSADRQQAVQARLDGFTFSRFSPYQDWECLLGDAKEVWNTFVETLRPTAVLRVAVRYINQINLPHKGRSLRFEDYLRTFPATGLEGDVDLEQFLLRLVMPQKDLNAKLILTEALLPPQGENLGVILDIDLFRENTTLDVRSADIWDILEQFRDRKNAYFEASITDAARELFA